MSFVMRFLCKTVGNETRKLDFVYAESMFTGLIAATGRVVTVRPRAGTTRIRVEAPGLAPRLTLGDSIAVSGVCLTALALEAAFFEADLAQETLSRTSLARLQPGTTVNLELPTPAGTPLGGHVVQGHVDGVGRLESMTAVVEGAPEQTDWLLRVIAPASLSRYIVEKGSIAIEGISLTVAASEVLPDGATAVTVAVIPHTYGATNLHGLQPGDEVNLEVDVLAKYAEQERRLRKTASSRITEQSLIAAGF